MEFEKSDLLRMINEPLPRQYNRIVTKVIEAVTLTNGDIVVCFSGGKDSALVLDMYCEIVSRMLGKSVLVKAAWANTTNETTAMKHYVPWFIERCERKYGADIQLEEVRPAYGDNIVTVMKREGLPFVSKMTSSLVRKVTSDLKRCGITYSDIKDLHKPTIKCRDALREMRLSDTTVLALTGWSCRQNDFGTQFILPMQWMPLLNIKAATGHDIRFTEKCCQILKKDPISRLNYPNIMTGEQAVESRSREQTWLKYGCNHKLPDNSVKSSPLGAVSLNAVLYAIHYRGVPLCSDYGEVVYCDKTKCYKCTGAQRTGCALCGFGIKFDPQRFVRLQETEPAKVAYAFKPIEQGGLGYLETCEYLNEYCGTKIEIPQI